MDHIFGAIGGTILAILGVFALGAYLANSRAGRMGLVAMLMTVVGQTLLLVIGGVSTFASNALGRAYLAGLKEVEQVEYADAFIATLGVAMLLALVGNVLLGV